MEVDCEQEQDAMPSPFPGMDPFLENGELWSEVHSRLIVAIADAIAPKLLPSYYVAIEKRTYLSTPEDSLLIGIPDVSVLGSAVASKPGSQPEAEQVATATLARPDKPQMVTIPMTEEVQERYLEIREAQTGQVVTAIELRSPTNGSDTEVVMRLKGLPALHCRHV